MCVLKAGGDDPYLNVNGSSILLIVPGAAICLHFRVQSSCGAHRRKTIKYYKVLLPLVSFYYGHTVHPEHGAASGAVLKGQSCKEPVEEVQTSNLNLGNLSFDLLAFLLDLDMIHRSTVNQSSC